MSDASYDELVDPDFGEKKNDKPEQGGERCGKVMGYRRGTPIEAERPFLCRLPAGHSGRCKRERFPLSESTALGHVLENEAALAQGTKLARAVHDLRRALLQAADDFYLLGYEAERQAALAAVSKFNESFPSSPLPRKRSGS